MLAKQHTQMLLMFTHENGRARSERERPFAGALKGEVLDLDDLGDFVVAPLSAQFLRLLRGCVCGACGCEARAFATLRHALESGQDRHGPMGKKAFLIGTTPAVVRCAHWRAHGCMRACGCTFVLCSRVFAPNDHLTDLNFTIASSAVWC